MEQSRAIWQWSIILRLHWVWAIPIRRNASARVCEQGCEEDDGSQGCLNTTAYYSKYLVAAETNLASSPMQTGCLHAVGSSMYVPFWIPAGRRGSGAISLRLQPSSTSLTWRCTSREYSFPSVSRDSNQGFEDRSLSERSIDILREGIM